MVKASGIDTKSLIQQLITVERQPQLAVKRRQLNAVNAASAIGELKTLMSTVQDKARELDASEEVSVLTAKSSDDEVLTADVLGTARPGIFNITVESLASAQKDRARIGDSLTTEVDAGEYTIEVEGEDAVSFELERGDSTSQFSHSDQHRRCRSRRNLRSLMVMITTSRSRRGRRVKKLAMKGSSII